MSYESSDDSENLGTIGYAIFKHIGINGIDDNDADGNRFGDNEFADDDVHADFFVSDVIDNGAYIIEDLTNDLYAAVVVFQFASRTDAARRAGAYRTKPRRG